MAPVAGCASATHLLFYRILLYLAVSTLSTNSVSAVIYYDRHTLFRIKEHMEVVCVSRTRYTEFFPPKFECSTSSPEYLLLVKPRRRGRKRKRGSRAGVQSRRRKWQSCPSWPTPGSSGSARCLRPVPICEGNRVCASPLLWTWPISDRIFPSRRTRNPTPRARILCPILCADRDEGQSSRSGPDRSALCAHPTRIALLNARSIANKALVLGDFFTKDHLDFMCLTETWQREREYFHLNELCPPDCCVIGTPRLARRGGGLALVYRSCFDCRLMDTLTLNSCELQMSKVGNTNFFYCVIVYRPPGPARQFLDEFSAFLSSIIKLENVLILGDMNLHIDDPSCLQAAELLTLMDSFNFIQHVSGPTHKKGHTLDLVFSLGLDINKLSVKDYQISDHCCILFDLSFKMVPSTRQVVTQRRILNETAISCFSASFEPSTFSDCKDIETFTTSFNHHCLSVLNKVAPAKNMSDSSQKPCPWMNETIRSFRRSCRKVERLWIATKLEVHRLNHKDMIMQLNNMINQARSSYFSNLVSFNKKNSKVLFNVIQSLVAPTAPQVPVYSQEDCNCLMAFFVQKVEEIRASIIPPLNDSNGVCSPMFPSVSSWSSFTPVSLLDVKVLVGKMKPSSSSVDIIPTFLLLNVFDIIGPWVVRQINLSLESGSVPSYFKHAVVNPLLKKPNLDPSEPNNYRPISKLPFMSKIMEKVVAGQLTSYMEDHNLFDLFQSGFRKMHSTETALLKVSSDIMMAADSGHYTVLVLLDLTSAFDTVDHEILIDRLKTVFGFSGSVLQWFSSYISDRTFNVVVNNIMSEMSGLSCGVAQGSVLGPFLFLLYLLPLGQIIQRFGEVSYHLYADDVQLYCSFNDSEFHTLSRFLDCLTSIKKWLAANYLQLNANKTETLIIAPENKIPQIKQHLGSLGSTAKTSLRNLGVIFDQAMSLEAHSKQLVKNSFYHLRNISKVRKMVSKSDLEKIIHAFISSRLDYCNSVFTCFNKKALNRLQLVQNSAARLLTGTPRMSHITPVLSTLHWLPVKHRIDFKILVVTFRALHSQAPQYILDLLTPYSAGRTLRSSSQNLLVIPKTRFKTRGDLSFQAMAPKLWNALPLSIREVDSVESFKKQLKTHLFRKAFG